MPLTHAGHDLFVSQDLSKLKEANARPLGAEFGDRDQWFRGFLLRRIFHAHVPDGMAPLAYAVLRKADAALGEYDSACASLGEFVRQGRAVRTYFRALHQFEAGSAACYQAFDFGRKGLKSRLFETADGTPIQRLNAVYNEGRHEHLLSLPSGHLHVVWLTNTDITTAKTRLSYEELRELVAEICRIANTLATCSEYGPRGTDDPNDAASEESK